MPLGGVGGAMNAGLAGIQQGQQKLTQAAQEVASSGSGSVQTDRPVQPNQAATQTRKPDLADSLMDQKEGQRQVEASAKVVDTANQTLGSLVDIKV